MNIGYARVSTRDQTVALQVDALKEVGCAKVYTEVISGAATERPILAKLLDEVRSGDIVVVWKLDRLGRSLKHLVETVNLLLKQDVGIKSLNDPIDTTTPQGRLCLIFSPPWLNLHDAGLLAMRGGKDRAEVQIVCEDHIVVRVGISHDFRIRSIFFTQR